MKKILFIISTIILLGFLYIWVDVESSIEASIAVNQVEDSIVTYSLAQKYSQGGILGLALFFYIGFNVLLWWRNIKQIWNNETKEL